jgi:hypothetical protein
MPNSLLSSPSAYFPTPPPDRSSTGEEATAQFEAERQRALEEWRQFQEDVTLDFAAFEGSIARIQFLRASNQKERERYAAEKLRILETAQSVKDNTAELRIQLEEAQKTLALRKTYDDLAEKITSNRLLRPREDQLANLEKLHAEIAKLEMESKEYAQTWSERREQFGRIVEEGMNLRRLIRDEKEEVDRREGMEEGEDGDYGDVGSKGRSVVGTPRPDQDGMTPSQPSQEDGGQVSGGLQVERQRLGGPGGVSPLRQELNVSAMASAEKQNPPETEDENMLDEGEVTGDESAAGTRSVSRVADEPEEGEEVSDDRPSDKMDTT